MPRLVSIGITKGKQKKCPASLKSPLRIQCEHAFFFGATLVWIARVYKNPITLCIFCCANQSILFRVSSRRQTNSMSRKLDSILKVLFNPRFFRQDACHRAINLAPNVYCWVHMFFKHIKHIGRNLEFKLNRTFGPYLEFVTQPEYSATTLMKCVPIPTNICTLTSVQRTFI